MDNAISVTQVNNYIKNIFDAELMLQNIFVYGEIGSYKITNGIAYFNLKDENALISCVLFGADKFPEYSIGDQVVVRGSVSYYSKGGKLNFNAYSIEKFGIGVLYQKFLELKDELEKKGYFNLSIKKPLPARVRRIGVVTSETGAVIRDIIDVSHRRNDTVDIVLYPCKVQGLGAEKEIASGIEFFSNYDLVDVIIVARGGGSIEDLQPYNTQIVADAVFNCKKPLVSAVGHETDYTIIDFVSDLRAPTPSAAAELVVNNKLDDIYALQNFLNDNAIKVNRLIRQKLQELKYISTKNNAGFNMLFNTRFNELSRILNKLNRNILDRLNVVSNNLQQLKLDLSKHDIIGILDRGYARIVKDGVMVKVASSLNAGDEVSIEFADGNVLASVSKKEE